MMEDLDLAEYEALLRADFAWFAARAFCELYPQTEFLASWHHRVIAAKLQAVFEGRIRRLIINKAYEIDNIAFIFHPAVPGRSVASLLGTRVECHAMLRRDDLDAAIVSSESGWATLVRATASELVGGSPSGPRP